MQLCLEIMLSLQYFAAGVVHAVQFVNELPASLMCPEQNNNHDYGMLWCLQLH